MPESTVNHQPSTDYTLRPAHLEDFEAIYDLFTHVLEDGTTYSYTREEMTPDRSLAYWISALGTHCFIADDAGKFAGCYALRPNRTGRGGHVANASFMVHPDYRRRGIGRKLGEHMLTQAQAHGYRAVQYNFVVSANSVAVKLWQSLGFSIVGTLPQGYQHAREGLVDVYIMHRFL